MANPDSFQLINDGDVPEDGYFNVNYNMLQDVFKFQFGDSVLNGLELTENGTPDLDVDVSAGDYLINGFRYTKTLDTITFTNADGSNPRIDLVSIDVSGTITITEGTPVATNPVAPAIPSDECPLAFVWRETSDNTIDEINIQHYRSTIPESKKGDWVHVGWKEVSVGNTSDDEHIFMVNQAWDNIKVVYSIKCASDIHQVELYFNDYRAGDYTYHYIDYLQTNNNIERVTGGSEIVLADYADQVELIFGEFKITQMSGAVEGIMMNNTSIGANITDPDDVRIQTLFGFNEHADVYPLNFFQLQLDSGSDDKMYGRWDIFVKED